MFVCVLKNYIHILFIGPQLKKVHCHLCICSVLVFKIITCQSLCWFRLSGHVCLLLFIIVIENFRKKSWLLVLLFFLAKLVFIISSYLLSCTYLSLSVLSLISVLCVLNDAKVFSLISYIYNFPPILLLVSIFFLIFFLFVS